MKVNILVLGILCTLQRPHVMHDGPTLIDGEIRSVTRHGILAVHDNPVDLPVRIIPKLLGL